MSVTHTFTDMEQIISTTARLIEEEKLYFVAIGGPPLVAVLLAKRLRAPELAYVVEDGTIAPPVPMPAPPFLIAASGASYRADVQHLMEFGGAQLQDKMAEYLEKWVFGVASHDEMLEKLVGAEKLEQLRAEETIREG